MKLRDLIKNVKIKEIIGNLNIDIKGVYHDSRGIEKDNLFVCIKGFSEDGHHFINHSIKNGATALIVEKKVKSIDGVTIIRVKNSRQALAQIANQFYKYPSQQLKLIGVTGTNGKTTITYMLKCILEGAGYKAGLLGTAENIVGDQVNSSRMTTMESIDLQKTLREMVNQDNDYVVMEVSSHALELYRVEGCDFETAIFTNISREHFELHKNFDNYIKAKKKLFIRLNKSNKNPKNKFAVINLDEEYSNEFLAVNKTNLITYGIREKEADVSAKNIHLDLEKLSFIAKTPKGEIMVHLKTSGRYNIYNALAAIAVAVTQNIPLELISKSLNNFHGAPGRYKILKYGQKFTVIIDFAHNYHGLGNILQNLRLFAKKRIITIFGHGGGKYHQVRAIIGEVLGRFSDYIVITADNPKNEDPLNIAREIEVGIKKYTSNYKIILDRKKAINYALEIAEEDDIVLIAGKGPETEQVYHQEVIHHNDEEVVYKKLLGSQKIESI